MFFYFFLITTDLHTMDIEMPCENKIKESLYKKIYIKAFLKNGSQRQMKEEK